MAVSTCCFYRWRSRLVFLVVAAKTGSGELADGDRIYDLWSDRSIYTRDFRLEPSRGPSAELQPGLADSYPSYCRNLAIFE